MFFDTYLLLGPHDLFQLLLNDNRDILDENKTFKEYVDYLGKNYVPQTSMDWVNHIREKGNEANHEIAMMKPDDAKELLDFIEMLLKLIYEFPATMRKKHPPAAAK